MKLKYIVLTLIALAVTASCARLQDHAETGPQGPVGMQGQRGIDGVDATPVVVVTLCATPTAYPSTFTEVAFCVGGKLYATYSANGGFSTELPPGVYQSNGINSSCTFTVLPNCEVQ